MNCFNQVPTPSFVVDEGLLKKNLELLQSIQQRTGCKILLAQKAFSMYRVYPMMRQYLAGTTASSLFEARLGREEMGGEVHIYSPAYREDEMDQIAAICDHIVFNTPGQWMRFRDKIKASGRPISCGIRINPEYSEIETDLYNPCFTGSRMGTTLAHLDLAQMDGIEGLHFHTMCEQNSDTLARTIQVVDEKFGPFLKNMKWINFGGGHHITRPDYDVECLIRSIAFMQEKYGLQVYLEPGEGVVLNTGFLVTSVLDTLQNGVDLAIVDTSAACHMPDVLEMPYHPPLLGSGDPGQYPYTYRLGGPTCLAGDIIGDYSFSHALKPGDRLVFGDMALYTMVKTNTFNGVNLPSIVLQHEDGSFEIVKQFGYEDFKSRLS